LKSKTQYTYQHLEGKHVEFVTYIRTKMFLNTRFRGIHSRQPVHISLSEIKHRFFPFPSFNIHEELNYLANHGEIAITKMQGKKTNDIFLLEALKPGPVNLSLLCQKTKIEDELTLKIKALLVKVSLPNNAPRTKYFDLFLKHKGNYLDLFFKVDDFSGRIHTPVTSLKSDYRANLMLDEHPTSSIDVATMQPLLLGKILSTEVGENQFSYWIDKGEDIYAKLQTLAKLNSRENAKKRFFEILFARPNNNLTKVFGEAEWIVWINQYKSKIDPRNPHSKLKTHSNLAWLLQTTEVRLMRKIWHQLVFAEIAFLSVHDEIIIKTLDLKMAMEIMNEQFNKEFKYYKFNIKHEKIRNPDTS